MSLERDYQYGDLAYLVEEQTRAMETHQTNLWLATMLWYDPPKYQQENAVTREEQAEMFVAKTKGLLTLLQNVREARSKLDANETKN